MTDINAALRGVQVLRAFRSGDVVFIETSQHLSKDQYDRISTLLKETLEPRGVTPVILGGDLHVVAASSASFDSRLTLKNPLVWVGIISGFIGTMIAIAIDRGFN